ncbi:MAG: lytic transglycosylase domain-containing protein [Stenotrophobium sp.]
MNLAWLAFALFVAALPAWAGPTGEPDPEMRQALVKAMSESSGFDNRFDAEVWLGAMSARLKPMMPDDAERERFLRLVHGEATHVNLAPEFVLSVIEVESRFNRYAISTSGAQGYMQIMPFWLKEIGKPNDNLFDPQTNLHMGCKILQVYFNQEHGDEVRALARYNGSLGRYDYPARVISASHRWWPQD